MADNDNKMRLENIKQMDDFFIDKKSRFNEYYKLYFPFELITKWLSYGNDSMFNKREIAYMIQNDTFQDEFCIRHNSYFTVSQFKTEVQKLVPTRIDIGALFDKNPSYNKDKANNIETSAIGREYIIDIDMTDYDNIRSCCQGKKICQLCWKFLECAYEVLNKLLGEYFNFKNLLWIFSGRRGIHCWVCDFKVFKLDNYQRSKMTEFLEFSMGNDKSGELVKPKILKYKEQTIFKEIRSILEKYFNDVKNEQKYFENIDNFKLILDILLKHIDINENQINKILEFEMKTEENNWDYLINYLNKNFSKVTKELDNFKFEVLFGLLYPKLDSNVSAQTNHLLKCPFNIHSSSGKISYPLKNVIGFDVKNAKTIMDILNKEKTLDEEIDFFKEFIDQCQLGNDFTVDNILK